MQVRTMAFEIIKGRNHGYPCIPELNEIESAAFVYPVNEFMLTGRIGRYPVIEKLPEVTAEFSVPFPECMMICFGESVNGGFPWIRGLKAIISKTESTLWYNGRRVHRMYFNEKPCKTAYCNGLRVFDTFSERTEIV